MSAIQNLRRVFTAEHKRQYYVYGEIIFKYRKLFNNDRSSSPELQEQMLQAVRKVDELYPWKDTGHDGSTFPSIKALYFSGDQFDNWHIPELNVWFRIEPTAGYLHKGQIYAYEKYLETLAQKLAEMEEFVGVATVRSMCRTCKSSEFSG